MQTLPELTPENFEQFIAITESNNQEWYAHLLEKAGNARAVKLASNSGNSCQYVIHPSTYKPGEWQVTTLQKWGGEEENPSGHYNAKSRNEALSHFAGMGGYWSNGRSGEYEIVETAGDITQA